MPKGVNFTPRRSFALPNLRRNDVTISIETDNELIENSERIDIKTEPGKFFVVLGDSVQGYYLVKCLLSNLDSFDAKYLSLCSESALPDVVLFKETRETDTFHVKTLVDEVHLVTKVLSNKAARLSVNKKELDDILVNIAEMSDT